MGVKRGTKDSMAINGPQKHLTGSETLEETNEYPPQFKRLSSPHFLPSPSFPYIRTFCFSMFLLSKSNFCAQSLVFFLMPNFLYPLRTGLLKGSDLTVKHMAFLSSAIFDFPFMRDYFYFLILKTTPFLLGTTQSCIYYFSRSF